NRVLLLEGTVEDPATEIELYCKKENWIGYFLPEEQNVFDALANIEEDIYHIKHEDYACWRYDYNISNVCTDGFKSGNALSPGTWVCNGQPVIKYGEMIKVSPLHNIPDFKWNNSGKPSSGEIRPKVEYYVYEKLADYATFVIELDTTETKPTEIAAFVNNSCVGACSVLPTDTVVVLSAYLGEQPGDSVVFEQHYGTTKQSNRAITNYLVKDNQRQVFERKAIRTGEKQEAYIISFNPEKLTNPIAGTTAELTLYPNPASHSVLLNVMLERKGFASMEVYDMQGRQVKVLISQELPAGNSMFNWDLTNQQGIRLQTGAYVVKLTTDQHSTTRKLLVE
ncbi:MAG: T9SS type A sorting domain-containing protein, partial [Bacteroidales bacterium]|nr:T9SS type A sorting domain-containing protein [Bacteroidales bacterium]